MHLQWLLGFVEEAEPAALLRHRFPSKAGGRPVRASFLGFDLSSSVRMSRLQATPTVLPLMACHTAAQAWLNPVHLPTAEQLTCNITSKPLDFLLQASSADDEPLAWTQCMHGSAASS